MGFWAWFWIWTALIIGALAVFALIGKSLFNSASAVFHQIERISKPALALAEAMANKPTLEDLESDLLTPVADAEAERTALLKQKSKKRAAQQRRLRNALKNIDVNESRFTND